MRCPDCPFSLTCLAGQRIPAFAVYLGWFLCPKCQRFVGISSEIACESIGEGFPVRTLGQDRRLLRKRYDEEYDGNGTLVIQLKVGYAFRCAKRLMVPKYKEIWRNASEAADRRKVRRGVYARSVLPLPATMPMVVDPVTSCMLTLRKCPECAPWFARHKIIDVDKTENGTAALMASLRKEEEGRHRDR